MKKHRVVVTGLGAVTPIGTGTKKFWESSKAGQNGIAKVTHFDTTGFRSQLAAEVKDYLLNFPNLCCEELTIEILDIVGEDRRISWSKVRTVDSLIIASALKNNVNKIISNDSHFKEALPKELLISFEKK